MVTRDINCVYLKKIINASKTVYGHVLKLIRAVYSNVVFTSTILCVALAATVRQLRPL